MRRGGVEGPGEKAFFFTLNAPAHRVTVGSPTALPEKRAKAAAQRSNGRRGKTVWRPGVSEENTQVPIDRGH